MTVLGLVVLGLSSSRIGRSKDDNLGLVHSRIGCSIIGSIHAWNGCFRLEQLRHCTCATKQH
jgi:hypothetical protein